MMSYDDVKQELLRIAQELAAKGLAYGQERVVLRAFEQEFDAKLKRSQPQKLKREQLVLTAWHDLFREGKLAWGYDTDNPNSPFFHVPVHTL
jgi:hypothetical protein